MASPAAEEWLCISDDRSSQSDPCNLEDSESELSKWLTEGGKEAQLETKY